jgi:hypothetical protein
MDYHLAIRKTLKYINKILYIFNDFINMILKMFTKGMIFNKMLSNLV